MNFKEEIINLLEKETKLTKEELTNLISIPPDSKLGDYAFPCFKLGNPKEEAEKLKNNLQLPNFISKVQAAGPYLNFFINHHILAETTLKEIYKEAKNYGKDSQHKSKRITIEYCGPNTNKPLHLGHLRNMALGNSVCRILEFQGNKIIPVNIINDRGIHICQSMLAYQKWGNNKELDKKGDHFVGDFYVLFSQKAKEDETLKAEAQELLVRWENNDQEVRKLWNKMNVWVLQGFQETYKRFGISFDKEYFESQYYEKGKEIAEEGLKDKIFEKDESGATIAPLEKYKMPNKVILRPDGTSVYITQDLYLASLRYRDYKFNKMIYVVASEQKNHFEQLFKILELLKKPFAKDLYHLSYGMVHLPSGRMKSREGTVIDADDLMDEVHKIAYQEVSKRYENLSDQEKDERAELIALGAVKFYMIKSDPLKDMVFNPEESLSFEGETGPYLQYTYARSCSILRKALNEHNLGISNTVNFETFNLEEELAVIRKLYEFPEIIRIAAKSYKPHHLAQYLIGLAQSFNEFYHKCPVISEQRNIMKARLLLVDCVRQVLQNGLNLLGIKAPEEM